MTRTSYGVDNRKRIHRKFYRHGIFVTNCHHLGVTKKEMNQEIIRVHFFFYGLKTLEFMPRAGRKYQEKFRKCAYTGKLFLWLLLTLIFILTCLLTLAPFVNLTVDTLAKGKASHTLLQRRFAPRKVVRLLPDKRGRLFHMSHFFIFGFTHTYFFILTFLLTLAPSDG